MLVLEGRPDVLERENVLHMLSFRTSRHSSPSVADIRWYSRVAEHDRLQARLCVLLVWALSLFLSAFVVPNYEQASNAQLLYYSLYNTGIGWFVGIFLLDRLSKAGLTLFAVRSCAMIIAGTLINEAVIEPLIFQAEPINGEGVYYGLADAVKTSALFVLLRLAGRLHAIKLHVSPNASRSLQEREAAPRTPSGADQGFFFVRVANETRRICAADVIYMRAERDFTRVICSSGDHFVSESLKNVLEKASGFGIVRIHKSYAVNLQRVERWTRTEVRVGDHRVPVGRRYWEASSEAWREQAFRHSN